MFGIKIQDSRKSNAGGDILNFDLRDILIVIGEPAREARWRCRDLYCTTVKDGKPFEIRQKRLDFSGKDFFKFALNIHQTIDGRFEVRKEGAAKKSWLVIIAFDSSWFEIWTSKPEIIKTLRDSFEKVSDISNSSVQMA